MKAHICPSGKIFEIVKYQNNIPRQFTLDNNQIYLTIGQKLAFMSFY